MSNESITERIQNQSNNEWLADLGGENNHYSTSDVNLKLKQSIQKVKSNKVPENIKNVGIISVRRIENRLLVTLDRYLTDELNNKIKNNIGRLMDIAEEGMKYPLYEYVEYRTFMKKGREYLALSFKDIVTSEIVERFYNIQLKNNNNKYFKTGENCEFRIKGRSRRPQKGMFIYFWMDAVKKVPDNRDSHIYRYMGSKLKNVAVSCLDAVPHHEIIKLKSIKYEGHLYDVT